MKDITQIELNAILYYADYLSLRDESTPVTDTCKYYFIHGCPINSAYIVDAEPVYNKNNIYLKQSYTAYKLIQKQFGDDGVKSFVEDICNIQACGMVDGIRMLTYLHQFSQRNERKKAFEKYLNYMKNIKYNHTVINDEGDPIIEQCSKYVYHYEQKNCCTM